jgi:hypothetical protein
LARWGVPNVAIRHSKTTTPRYREPIMLSSCGRWRPLVEMTRRPRRVLQVWW